MAKVHEIKNSFEKFNLTLNPFIQGVFWLLAFGLGAFASLFSTEIKNFTFSYTGSINIHSYIFFGGAFFLACFFSFSAWVKSKKEDFLFGAIQTSPPKTFWEKYSESIKKATLLLEKTEYEASQKNWSYCETNVRITLDMLINLVKAWDTANIERKVIYRANVMKVVYFKDNPEYTVLGEDDYFHQPVKEHYSGVVTLEDNKYTTTTESKAPDPDSNRKAITFAFCNSDEDDNSKFHSNVRGAPYSVATNEYSYVSNVSTIPKSYKGMAEPNSIRIYENLVKYYSQKDNPALSILSIPLYGKGNIEEDKARWVLNIYRNQVGMLYEGTKCNDFKHVSSNFILILSSMLDIIEFYKAQTQGVPANSGAAQKTNTLNAAEKSKQAAKAAKDAAILAEIAADSAVEEAEASTATLAAIKENLKS